MYLVERMELDPMENRIERAVVWVVKGYVDNLVDASEAAKEEVEGTGWPLEKGRQYPLYRFTSLERFNMDKQS
jgi:hypothetical protein